MKKKITAVILIVITGVTGLISGWSLYPLLLKILDKVSAFYRFDPLDNTYWVFILIASIILVFLAFYRMKWHYDLSKTIGSIEQMNGKRSIDLFVSCVFIGLGVAGLVYSFLIVSMFILFGEPLPA